nr:hypothetical protein 5 [Piscirickettsiaceae bacterium]
MNIRTRTFKVPSANEAVLRSVINQIQQQKQQDQLDQDNRYNYECQFVYSSINNQATSYFSGDFFNSLPINVNPKLVGVDSANRSITIRCYYIDFLLQQIVDQIRMSQQQQFLHH